jgi:hypothetical protein
MYGQCSPSGRGDDGHYYCKYEGEAIKQNSTEFLTLFKEVCPNLYNGTEHTTTCCDLTQLKYMDSQLSVPKQLMSRCPACLVNFKSFLCDMTCSNKQSEFINTNPSEKSLQSLQKVSSQNQIEKKESGKMHDSTTNTTTHENNDDYSNDVEEGDEEGHDENTDVKEIKHEKKEGDEQALTDKEDVITYTYFITTTYVNQMFNSCKCVFYFMI